MVLRGWYGFAIPPPIAQFDLTKRTFLHGRGRYGNPCAHLGACCAGNWSVEVIPAAKGDRSGLVGEPRVEIYNVFRRRRASCRWIFQPVARVCSSRPAPGAVAARTAQACCVGRGNRVADMTPRWTGRPRALHGLVLDRMVAWSTYVCEAGCDRLPIQSPATAASDAGRSGERPPCRVTRDAARGGFRGPIWQTNEFRSSFSEPIGRKTSFGVVEMVPACPMGLFWRNMRPKKGR